MCSFYKVYYILDFIQGNLVLKSLIEEHNKVYVCIYVTDRLKNICANFVSMKKMLFMKKIYRIQNSSHSHASAIPITILYYRYDFVLL